MENNIIIYQTEDGETGIDVRLEQNTVWLTQEQMAMLFGTKRPAITKHINNICKTGELDLNSTCSILEHMGSNQKQRYTTKYYNLDMIIAVGYRVTSLTATRFRQWATNTLRDYLVNGYVINEKRLIEKTQQIKELQKSIILLNRCIENQAQDLTQAQILTNLMADFSVGLTLLDDFDNQNLDTIGKTNTEAVKISTQEFLEVIDKMKPEFGSDIFANQKDESFDSSINQIYQTFGGNDCYPTLEEKATMLLYFIVKNHSFSDGNKRIGANCFLYFLQKNNMLYNCGKSIVDNATLAAITLLIAESKPEEKETIIKIVLSILNRS